MNWTDQLDQLEHEARKLHVTPGQRKDWQRLTLAYGEDFLDSVNARPAFVPKDERAQETNLPLLESPRSLAELLHILGIAQEGQGLNAAGPGHLAYIPGGGLFASALGDYLASVSNTYAGISYVSPGAVNMEASLIRWMAEMVGFGKQAAGNITSGGSMANLAGIVAARDALDVTPKAIPYAVIYTSDQAHHSIQKALSIAGLNEAIVRYLPIDDRFRIDAQALETQILTDTREGLRPFLLIASAGTTHTGAVDPLFELGEIAEAHKLWFHVDAAYGAYFALVPSIRPILNGMQKGHSITMDPHKGLFVPYGCGVILARNGADLTRAFAHGADYMQDAEDGGLRSPADYGPELTKHHRSLRLWLPLHLHGLGAFRAALEEKYVLAQYAWERLSQTPGFEMGPSPDLSVFTFRYLPKKGDPNVFNQRLIQAIHHDGKVFLSSTMISNRFVLRMAILSFRSHRDIVDLAIERLEVLAGQLDKS